jgi:thiamine-monophosphate kinase
MAAEPIGLLIAATIPANVAESIELLADGIGQAAREGGCPIVGGDLTGGDRISLTMTVLGVAPAPVGRGGAKVGEFALGNRKVGGAWCGSTRLARWRTSVGRTFASILTPRRAPGRSSLAGGAGCHGHARPV